MLLSVGVLRFFLSPPVPPSLVPLRLMDDHVKEVGDGLNDGYGGEGNG